MYFIFFDNTELYQNKKPRQFLFIKIFSYSFSQGFNNQIFKNMKLA